MIAQDLGEYVELAATTQPVVIWSGEHRAWWRENKCGYTTEPSRAGVYSLAEAIDATHHVGPEKQIRIENIPEGRRVVDGTALRLAIADAAIAYHDRSETKHGVGLRVEWEKLSEAVKVWKESENV